MKNVKKIEIKLEKEWVESLDAVFKKKNKDVKIDGFRKRKAPRNIYEKKYGKQELIYSADDKAIQDKYAKYGRSQLMLNNTGYAFRKQAVSKPDDHEYFEKLMLNYGQYLSNEDYDEFYEIYVYNKVVDLYWEGSYLEAKELLYKGLERLTFSKSLRDLELQLQNDENFKD